LSFPLYHYVLPITVFDATRGAKYGEEVIKMPTKRWDTLAWFQITKNKGDFESSFNLGQIQGKFGVPSTDSSKAAERSVAVTVRKPAAKKTGQNDPNGMHTVLAEYMLLNATKANLAETILLNADDQANAMIMIAIDARRVEIAAFLKRN
jgi:hypothetical protein